MKSAAPLALVVVLLAGCLGSDPGADLAVDEAIGLDALSWPDLGALVFSDSHDHTNRTAHLEVARNVTVLNFSNFNEEGVSLGEYTEADVENGIVAVAVTTGDGVDVRVVLLEEAALPELRVLGTIDEPRAYGDVKLDDELPLVYVPFPSSVRTTSPRPTEPMNPTFSIWDISSPESPRRVGEAPGMGCHTLHPLHVAGAPYVWCTSVEGPQTYRIEALPTGGYRGVPLLPAEALREREVLRYNDYYKDLTPVGPALIPANHDMTAQPDPLTGDPLLVVAHELNGIRIFDIVTPAAPREISYWRGEGLSVPMDRVHSAGLVDIGGKRIGIGLTETFTKVLPSAYIVDFTDYANPKLLVHWTPPGIPSDERIVYSMHNFQVVGTRLYMTNFHAGLWVVDIASPEHPQVVALRTPVRESGYPRPTEQVLQDVFMDQNWYWDVVVASGYVLVTDMSSGVEVLHVEGDPPGDQAHRGFA